MLARVSFTTMSESPKNRHYPGNIDSGLGINLLLHNLVGFFTPKGLKIMELYERGESLQAVLIRNSAT